MATRQGVERVVTVGRVRDIIGLPRKKYGASAVEIHSKDVVRITGSLKSLLLEVDPDSMGQAESRKRVLESLALGLIEQSRSRQLLVDVLQELDEVLRGTAAQRGVKRVREDAVRALCDTLECIAAGESAGVAVDLD